MKIALSFDLGADTLKISYAYKHNDNVQFGKIIKEGMINQVALPANAFYDSSKKQWVFSDLIDDGNYSDFMKTVKIKTLLSLLLPGGSLSAEHYKKSSDYKKVIETFAKNRDYYFNKHHFPKFYFPIKREIEKNFDEMVKKTMTFTDNTNTPHDVVLKFFQYIKKVIDLQLANIVERYNLNPITEYEFSIIVPAVASDEYKNELQSIIASVFNVETSESKNIKCIAAPKAIGVFAFHENKLKPSQKVLIFDMGENSISVVKSSVGNSLHPGIIVEGADGHSSPINIGGSTIDEEIVKFLEGSIKKRETVGSPSHDEIGHINESPLYAKQYLLMKEIKKAKMILSKNEPQFAELFSAGVPICLYREVLIQKMITKKQFLNIIGISNDDGVAKQISEYIINEIKLGVNKDVSQVLLSGGLVESYGLFSYLKEKIEKNTYDVKVIELDSIPPTSNPYAITDYDNSTYSASLGGALASVCNYNILTVLALSYGTWHTKDSKKGFSFIANKHSPLNGEVNTFYTGFRVSGEHLEGDEMFSTSISKEEVESKKVPGAVYLSDGSIEIGNPDSAERKKMIKNIDLKVVSGGKQSKIIYKYNDKRVQLLSEVDFMEGVEIDADGRAKPFLKNNTKNDAITVGIKYMHSGQVLRVYAKDIKFEFEGFNSFTVIQG